MSKSRASALLALTALVLIGVWVDVTGYIDVFSDPTATDRGQEMAHYSCYAGRICASVAFLLFPRTIERRLEGSVALMPLCTVGGTLLYSFGFYQALFEPTLVASAGSMLIGAGHIWTVTSVYLYLLATRTWEGSLWLLVAAQVAERICAELLGFFSSGTSLVVLSYLLPVAATCALAAAMRVSPRRRPAASPDRAHGPSVRRSPIRAYYVTLCVMAGVGLVACGAMSTVGIWGSAGDGQFAGEAGSLATAVVECALVVALCRVTFVASRGKPLALRYQSSLLVLITGFVIVSSRQLLAPVPDGLVNVLLVSIENYAHILIWVVAFDAAAALDVASCRVFGVALMSCSAAGLAWNVLLEHQAVAGESVVFVLFYLLLVVCVVYPQVFNRHNVRLSSDEGVINEFVIEGERRLSPGVNGGALQRALEERCACVAGDYGLSSREGDVLVLLAKGYTRQDICHGLRLSEGTVKTHLAHVYGKMGVHSRTELLDVIYGTAASE